MLLHCRILEALVELGQTHVLDQLLEQDLEEDARRAGRVVLGQPDVLEHVPADGVGEQQLGEQFRRVAQLVRVQPVHRVVRVAEDLLERAHVRLVDLTEPLSQEGEEFLVGALLGAAVKDHVAQLRLQAGLELHQLVGALVVFQTVHHRQVDGATQRRQVRSRFVPGDAGVLFLLVFVLLIGGVAAVAVRVFAVRGGRPVAVVGNDLLAHRLVLLLVGQVVRVVLEHVEDVLRVELLLSRGE